MNSQDVAILSKYLEENNCLEVLNLEGKFIGDKGVEVLTDALKKNSELKSLNLCNNGISDRGAECIAQLLKTKRSGIQELNISQNQIREKFVVSEQLQCVQWKVLFLHKEL